MNKGIYRLVWNSRLGAPQVVSEVAKSKTCGGSVVASGPGARTSRSRGKAAAWPLALLSLGIASSVFAVPVVTTGADSGAGSLRERLATSGSAFIDPSISTITLVSDLPAFNGVTMLDTSAPLTITGGSLVGSGSSLSLSHTGAGTLTTAISGQFTGSPGSGGTASAGMSGSNGSTGEPAGNGNPGANGTYSSPTSGSSAISGNFFAITNNAAVTGGLGVSSVGPGAGGKGGNGGNNIGLSKGGAGGAGGAGANGGTGSAGGAGISGTYFSVTNNASIYGGNGSNGTAGGAGGSGGNGSPNSGWSNKYGGGGKGGDGGKGGSGGAGGIAINGSHIWIVNTGTIQGGNGGTAGIGGIGGIGGTSGAGGTPGTAGTAGGSGSAGAGGVGIVATSASVIRNSGTISGGYADAGNGVQANAIELSGGDNKLVLEAGSVINGSVVSASGGSDVLALGGDENSLSNTFDLGSVGSMAKYQGFGGFEKEGSSTWTLTGNDSAGQDWTVRAGSLAMASGSSLMGSVDVSSGATLNTGSASIGGDVNNVGTLRIGTTASPYATLAAGGDYSQGNNSTLQVSAFSSSQFSKLNVNGNVQLDGTLAVDVKVGNTLANGNLLGNVIKASGTLDGQFSSITDNSLLFDFTPIYNSQSVGLSVVESYRYTATGSAQALGNTQARGAAAVVDQVIASNPGGSLARQFIALSTQTEVSQALSEALPMAGGSKTAANTALTSINLVVQTRNETVSGLSSGDEVMADEHIWIKPFGSWVDLESSGGAVGMRSSVGGVAFGLEGSLRDSWTLGAAFVYANADTRNNGNSTRQSLDTDVYQLVGYGTYHLDDSTALRLQIDGGQNRNEGKRDIAFAGLQAKSSYNTWTAHAGAALDHTIRLSTATRFTPSLRADYTWIKDDAYTEKGADSLNLKAKSNSTDQFILGVDGKLVHDFTEQVSLSGNLGVGYDFMADRDSISTTFAGAPGAAFTTYGGDAQRWLVRGGTGLSYQVNDQLQLAVRYDLEKRSDYLNQTASAEARWAF
ncbi:autotransporter domain-containing protein [Pseudomonas sp. TMP25]|uniref:autotransporter domain-containing protein n=1 Tax=Pseudomonas sp. TMP25 TaxID=3136561 RepID=UPI003100F3FD